MELIIGGVFLLVFAVLTGVYLGDRDGWHKTFKRVARISRASLEARSFKSIEKLPTAEKDRWEAEFQGRSTELDTLPVKPEAKHVIVKRDYYESHFGPWPRWVCKCGSSDTYVAEGTLFFAKRAAIYGGNKHVRQANKWDRHLGDGGKDFLF